MSHGHRGPALFRLLSGMSALTLKSDVRAASLARRAAISERDRVALVSRLAEVGPAVSRQYSGDGPAIVSAFLPIRGEVDTMPLIVALNRAGFETALPVTPARGDLLRFHLWRPGDALAAGSWRIPEPLPDSPQADPDVLFVPLAAFDRGGHRLGYGAGFYDNALARLRRHKRVLAIGVAFALQEVEAVPAEPHDERLDVVITERDTIFIAAA